MPYRVLSLDGGGPWAIIQAKALIDLFNGNEATSGWDVLRQFDLVSANSGGSIVLGCLVENMTLGAIRDLFLNDAIRESIFSQTDSTEDKIINTLVSIGPKYSTANKLTALQTQLPGQGNKPLTQVVNGLLCHRGTGEDIRLLIIGFDYDRCRATFFRSTATGGASYGVGAPATVTLAQAIHASTNAPIDFFDAPATFPPAPLPRYWDGAVAGFNNPVLAGVTEAITATTEFTQIVALSLGTASVILPWPADGAAASPFTSSLSATGLVNDLEKMASSILDDPPDLASFIAHVMTGSGANVPKPADSQIVRMSPMVSPIWDAATNAWKAPGTMTPDDFNDLATMPMDAPKAGNVQTIANFADLWLAGVARNQPIRMNSATLAAEIGQDWYAEAKAAWIAVSGWAPPTPAPPAAPAS